MNEDAFRRGLLAVRAFVEHEADQELQRRIQQVDRDNMVLQLRLPPPQSAALTAEMLRVAEVGQRYAGTLALPDMIHFLSYGFQLGYDYALTYGRIPEENREAAS